MIYYKYATIYNHRTQGWFVYLSNDCEQMNGHNYKHAFKVEDQPEAFQLAKSSVYLGSTINMYSKDEHGTESWFKICTK